MSSSDPSILLFCHPLYTMVSFCITQRYHKSTHLHTRHHRPFTISAMSPLMNLTVTMSKNIVNKSLVVSFFTFSSGGPSMWWRSSMLLSWSLSAYIPCESMVAMQVYHDIPHCFFLQAHHEVFTLPLLFLSESYRNLHQPN